jgi:hypothetical protein
MSRGSEVSILLAFYGRGIGPRMTWRPILRTAPGTFYDRRSIFLSPPVAANTREMAMLAILQQVYALIARSLSPEPTIRFGGNSGRDALPPVLGPSEWSQGLLEGMADSSTAWYFDRR